MSYCSTCGAQLARSAMGVQTMQLAMWAGAIAGFVIVGFAWLMLTHPLLADSYPAVWFLSSLIMPFVGAWLGIRAALVLMGR